jgi:hypothetical protein
MIAAVESYLAVRRAAGFTLSNTEYLLRSFASFAIELKQLHVRKQANRFESDPWEELIEPWVENRTSASVSETLSCCLDKPRAQWTQVDKNRVARCFRALGWERYRERQSARLEWRYRRAES